MPYKAGDHSIIPFVTATVTVGELAGKRKTPAGAEASAGEDLPEKGPARLERATSCSGGKRSIQLSYGPV